MRDVEVVLEDVCEVQRATHSSRDMRDTRCRAGRQHGSMAVTRLLLHGLRC